MGMLGKLVTGTLLSRALRRHEATRRGPQWSGATEYVPASDLDRPRGTPASRNALVGRATQFYRDNPALVHALAATAGAILLTRMRRRT